MLSGLSARIFHVQVLLFFLTFYRPTSCLIIKYIVMFVTYMAISPCLVSTYAISVVY